MSDYLKQAVNATLQNSAGLTDQQIEQLTEHLDYGSFVDENGDLDLEKVTEHGRALAPYVRAETATGVEPPVDPVAAALNRMQNTTPPSMTPVFSNPGGGPVPPSESEYRAAGHRPAGGKWH